MCINIIITYISIMVLVYVINNKSKIFLLFIFIDNKITLPEVERDKDVFLQEKQLNIL